MFQAMGSPVVETVAVVSLEVSVVVDLGGVSGGVLVGRGSRGYGGAENYIRARPLVTCTGLLLFRRRGFTIGQLNMFCICTILYGVYTTFYRTSMFQFYLMGHVFIGPHRFWVRVFVTRGQVYTHTNGMGYLQFVKICVTIRVGFIFFGVRGPMGTTRLRNIPCFFMGHGLLFTFGRFTSLRRQGVYSCQGQTLREGNGSMFRQRKTLTLIYIHGPNARTFTQMGRTMSILGFGTIGQIYIIKEPGKVGIHRYTRVNTPTTTYTYLGVRVKVFFFWYIGGFRGNVYIPRPGLFLVLRVKHTHFKGQPIRVPFCVTCITKKGRLSRGTRGVFTRLKRNWVRRRLVTRWVQLSNVMGVDPFQITFMGL